MGRGEEGGEEGRAARWVQASRVSEVFGFIFCPMEKGQIRGDVVVNYKHLFI